ncbi:hypothetical protein ACLB1N_03480 [Escherichia coli]
MLGKEVRLRNAYVIKAERRLRKMPKVISPPSSVLMTPIPLSKILADCRKVKVLFTG